MAQFDFHLIVCQNCKHWKMFSVGHTGQCRAHAPGLGKGRISRVDWHGSEYVHTARQETCGQFHMHSDPKARLERLERDFAQYEAEKEKMDRRNDEIRKEMRGYEGSQEENRMRRESDRHSEGVTAVGTVLLGFFALLLLGLFVH